MHDLRDFRPDLRGAIGCLHHAGFDGEAYVLASAMEGAYASSLEMVQAIGAAVLRVERALGADLPAEVGHAFRAILAEVARAAAALAALNRRPADQPPGEAAQVLAACSSS
jgi:hypothetical protein